MDWTLVGKRAMVCGGSRGIGRACALELARLGAGVTLIARSEERLGEVAAQLPAEAGQQHGFLSADFDRPDELRARLEEHLPQGGSYQILLNNSGGPRAGPLFEAHPEEFLVAITRHILCNQILAQALVPGMKEAGYGRIINIISTSVREPIANLGVSNTTRGAVASWAKTLSRELGPFGITVNNILPGYTDTERLHDLIRNRAAREGAAED
ncbi:MAG: SDR family NAD(P)-dependent oxidoreductase, partial [Planctomycetota bacterium]